MPDTVHIRYAKWDGSLHWHFDARRIDQDSEGDWFLVSPGGEYRRGDDPPRLDEHGFVLFSPHRRWWTAYFNAVPRATKEHLGHLVYVDINTPGRWEGNTLHLIDLDLDVTLSPDGTVRLLDEDEFDQHRIDFSYPGPIVAGTRTAADRVRSAMERRAEPFGVAGFRRVAEHLGWTHGTVVPGHGAASGALGDPRFPKGTLSLQAPHFERAGVDLDGFYLGTINIESTLDLESREPVARILGLEWLDGYPRENFDFLDARISVAGEVHRALIYLPDPATKPEFDQPAGVFEVLAAHIPGIEPGAPVSVWVDPDQGRFVL